MSKKSATNKIKGLNPKNISGTIPQALDLIQQLQKVQGNPKMVDAVGLQNLLGMLKFVGQKFSKGEVKDVLTLDKILRAINVNYLNITQDQFVIFAKEILGVNDFKEVLVSNIDLIRAICSVLIITTQIEQVLNNYQEIVENSLIQLEKVYKL